ncbi:MAG: hypothetical protein LBQ34_00875 [Alphaproteobacteria bacterium]|jgi:hypothetical protein|nr:hypothetical protein [Alphaproteobacteria bacterium]
MKDKKSQLSPKEIAVAKALRENLRKRKAQKNKRKENTETKEDTTKI